MNTDKAYLLGLIIGGGVFGNAEDVFIIKLPYKKWGSYISNPARAGQIINDILCSVGQMFRAIYNLAVQYETLPGGTWKILCEGDNTPVKDDLQRYGIHCEGEIRTDVDISQVVRDLVDDNLKRRFIAGLADTIGSMAKSQRRFTDEHQIISFEINGYNYKFVCDLCNLLYSINCIPDQINWNHPNIHCPGNPYYKQWNKGFKLRILLDQYAQFGAFAFRTKAEASRENRRLQQQQHVAEMCETREIRVKQSTIHPAENDMRLPEQIRGGHYLHFRHFCAVMGCEHAPYDKICPLFNQVGELINPFPILCKDLQVNIQEIIDSDSLLSQRTYTIMDVSVASLLQIYNDDSSQLLYGVNGHNGYPISQIMQAVAYVIANNNELTGKRPIGGYIEVIQRHITGDPSITVEFRKPELLTPLVIVLNGKGALVGANNPEVYRRLVARDTNNQYKLIVRQITEEDLRNA
ncbi:hypothetical protein [Ruminococcus sp.]|uniref:hypothetical protein n=1 Tax=Ruminococcus sp. TaxID=41978 RepID=UPI002E77C20A|nr:hypothetical protein [Ruminococcus sp.]MEE1263138.1 hypothetical protein [Ruminococcus sp.]